MTAIVAAFFGPAMNANCKFMLTTLREKRHRRRTTNCEGDTHSVTYSLGLQAATLERPQRHRKAQPKKIIIIFHRLAIINMKIALKSSIEILPRKFSKWKRDPECIIPLTGQKGAANCWVVGVARVHSLAWSGLTMFEATANTSLRINCCTRIASVQLFLYAHFFIWLRGCGGGRGWLYRRLPPIDCYLQICLHIRLKRQWLMFSDIYTRIYKTIFQIWNIYFNTKQSGSLK